MLGAMAPPPASYRETAPGPALAPFVERLWVADSRAGAPRGERRILPDGCMDIVWLADGRAGIAGPQTTYLAVPPRTGTRTVGARFRPGALPALLRHPAREFVDAHVPLEAVDGGLAARLADAALAAGPDDETFAALEDALARALAPVDAPDPVVLATARLLGTGAGVAAASSRVYLSERQLHRRFVETVGYGPKTLQRILRFQQLVRILGSREGEPALGAAAHAAGYADQPHLTRETRRLSGFSPRELLGYLNAPSERVRSVQDGPLSAR